MNKRQKIEFKPGYIVWLDKEEHDGYQDWYEFCNLNYLKPRGDCFYKELVEYYDCKRKN